MGKLSIMTLLFVYLFSLSSGQANAAANTQNERQRPLHDEVPGTDLCSLIIIQIRQLAYELNEDAKEKSLLEQSLQAPPENYAKNELRQNGCQQRLKLLEKKISSLREQINTKENLLESCLRNRNKSPGQ